MKGVKVSNFIVPMSVTDTYPTNLDIFGRGGIHSVDAISNRDAITTERRSEGMLSFTKNNESMYALLGGITNDKWFKLFDFSDNKVNFNIACNPDYVLVGDGDGVAIPSPILIDIRLDMIDSRRELEELSILKNLGDKKIWIGDSNNKPAASQTIAIDNLPNLGVTNTPNPLTLGFVGKVWEGTSSGRPEESSIVGDMFADILLLNARFLAANFIMGSSSHGALRVTMPQSQFIEDLPVGLIKRIENTSVFPFADKYLGAAIAGTDYLPGISQPPLPDISNFLLYSNNKVYQCPITYLEDPGGNGIFNFDGGTIKALNFAAKRHNGQDASITVEGNAYISETIGARRIVLYDSKELAHRREDGVMLEGPSPLPIGTMLKWIMPSDISTEGQILKDIGANIGGGRLLGFRNILPDGLINTLLAQGEVGGRKTFVNATLTHNKFWLGDVNNMPIESDLNFAPNDASYILKTPNNSLNNAQALSELAGGILKSATLTGTISIASGGKIPITNDYVRPIDLQEEIEGVIAEATEAGSVAGGEAGTVSGTAAATAEIAAAMPGILVEAGTAGGTAGGIAGGTAGTAAAALVLFAKESTSDHNADISAVNTRIDNLHIPPSNAKYILNQQASGLSQAQVLSDLIGGNYPNGGLLKVTSIDGIIKIASPTVDYADPNKENTFLEKIDFQKDVRFLSKGAIKIPVGDSAQRPSNSSVGMVRYNTEL